MAMDSITKQYIRENLNADVPTLALKKAPVGTDVSLALRQIAARQLLQKKVPSWSENEDLLFPAHLSLEQCSSELDRWIGRRHLFYITAFSTS